ncbi:peptidase domain-containing ABC transporter [Thalassotalea sp. HSM 43]|uniref:peptidase domain-containing ABC transporter n=1 Tax=Thalassotalea sp. HSM 43 TaxID=2552945 RepID=UPI001081CDFB|nr:peptidase domain-containing ABC transporter [Thalassotalea sp. HSM 43]QBY03092.1 peptidase domain-containing ABC transporter [Thalassotalea sp. HSM 43]
MSSESAIPNHENSHKNQQQNQQQKQQQKQRENQHLNKAGVFNAGLEFFRGQKLPVILQTEASECALACLAMVASFHGFKTDLAYLRHQFAISSRGATLAHVIDIADGIKLNSRPLKLALSDLTKLTTPCILHWDLNHFVVLKSCKGKRIVIHDPALGEKTLSLSECGEHFTGVAVELIPNEGFVKARAKQSLRISDFARHIVGLWPTAFKVLALSVMLQLFAIATPYYLQLVIDDVVVNGDSDLLMILALGFALLALFELVSKALRSFVILHCSNVLNLQMASQLCHHLLRLPLAFFQRRHMGDIVSRFGSMDSVRQLLSNGLVEAIVDGLMVIVVLVMMCLYSVKLTMIVMVAVSVYAIMRSLCYKPLKQLNEQQLVAGAKQQSRFMENVRAIETIKHRQCEHQRQQVWQQSLVKQINLSIKLGKLRIHFNWLHDVIFAAENLLVIYIAATLVMAGDLSIGMLTAFIAYKRQLISKLINLIERLIDMKMLTLHLSRIADIALTDKEPHFDNQNPVNAVNAVSSVNVVMHPPMRPINPVNPVNPVKDTSPINPTSSSSTLKTQAAILRIEDLAFRYHDKEPWLFKNVSFSVTPGQVVAIIGASGSGKTSLLKVLMGLQAATQGRVCFYEHEINQYGLGQYRRKLSAVLQDDQLISGSLIDNISFFAEQVDRQKLANVIEQAQLSQDIKSMPMGVNSLIGEMGSNLSGGQKQRLLLARALYQQPEILFLDEATSHLDSNNEFYVNQAINALSMTRIIVAHRLETIMQADVILQLTTSGVIDCTDKVKSQYAAARRG